MIAEFRSENVKNDYLALNKVHSKKFLKKCLLLAVALIAVGALLLLVKDSLIRALSVFLIVLGAVYYPLILWLNKRSVRKQLVSNGMYASPEPSCVYFDEETVTQEQGAGDHKNVITVFYAQMCSAIETEEYFFCYNSNSSAVPALKAGLIAGSEQAVREKLTAALGKKFKRM